MEPQAFSRSQFPIDGRWDVDFGKQLAQEVDSSQLPEGTQNISISDSEDQGRSSLSLASISSADLPSVSRLIPRAARTSLNSGTVSPTSSAAFAREMRPLLQRSRLPLKFEGGVGIEIEAQGFHAHRVRVNRPYSCINFADKVKKSPVFQHLRIATGSWLDFTSGEFQRQPQRADYVLQFRRQTVRRRDPTPQ